MNIKKAILQEEKDKVEKFLNSFELNYSKDINVTFYIEEDGKIIGTISCSDYIIKDVAIDKNYQGENIATILITEALLYFRENNVFSYQVFTKPVYENIFSNFGFKELVKTEKVVMMEAGIDSINDEIAKIKTRIEMTFSILDENADLGAIVMNANPITNGHVHLIEQAAKQHKMLLVFIVEEDKSLFSFKERLTLAYLATKRLSNVCVLPSTKYIVSKLTFPDYFLKNETEKAEENAKIDALIFKNYFMKELFIKKRYVGSETTNKMIIYNNALKEILNDKLEIIPRLKQDGYDISAKRVRSLIMENKIDEATKLIPRECLMVFSNLAVMKNAK